MGRRRVAEGGQDHRGQVQLRVVATKSILDLVHPAWAIPAPLVALLLG
ncbi:MAG TPA: hypothetical protein VMU63_07430 [Acidimicrobiales bacterium]|nr:hypothetical protein [Acidimicrobiales bacterium]